MGSVYTDEESRSAIARRLSILPATIGMIGVCVMVAGSAATGLVAEDRGWSWVMFAASLILATVLSGAAAGLYIGLAILCFGAMTSGDELSLLELCALALTVFVVHETVRFSLDARRPSRFGPGFVGGYIARTVGASVLVVATVAAAWPLVNDEPRGLAWIPIGLAVAALPLFSPFAAAWLDERNLMSGPRPRAAIAAVVSAAVIFIVVLAAQARTAIESGPVGSSSNTPEAPPPPTTVPRIIGDTDPASIQRFLIFAAVMTAVLVVGVLYLALRRPEAAFELDEIDQNLDDMSFGIAIPGKVDQEDEVIEVDDQDLAQLLRDIQLDIETEQDPGRAIRYGYATIERRLADLRLTRDDSETEREFLLRALPRLGAAGEAMALLTRLFEQARFSHDPVDEAMRERALGAIGELVDHLEADADPDVETATETTADEEDSP